MMNKNIIFHIPLKLNPKHASASQIRPMRMLEGFRQLGYQVDVVEGSASERKRQISNIKKKIKSGTVYDFVYSESSTMPTLLTEKHHLPTHPFLDFGFFAFCKKHNIPIGLFYRDIYWCFINKNKGWKQLIAKYFYRYDLKKYTQLVDVFCLPSMEMLRHIPFDFPREVMALPPGCELHPHPTFAAEDTLRLLYIGGVGGGYDIHNLLQAVNLCPHTQLTLCCRTADWEKIKDEYASLLCPRISIVHQSGNEIFELYQQADLFIMPFSGEYWAFAVPFKLFEAVGYQLPILTNSNTWCGNFVQQNHIGLTVDDSADSLVAALNNLHENPQTLQEFSETITAIAPQNTWQCRCKSIAEALTKQTPA